MYAELEIYRNQTTGIKVSGARKGLRNVRCLFLDPFKPSQLYGIMPLAPKSIEILKEHNVAFSSHLVDWLFEDIKRREMQQEMYLSGLVLDKRLRDYQNKGLGHLVGSRIWGQGVRALLADDPRLGKTAQSLIAATYIDRFPILVVTMKALITHWVDSVLQWTSATPVDASRGSVSERLEILSNAEACNGIYITNWETLRKLTQPKVRKSFPKQLYSTIIGDEVHILRNRKSQVFKGISYLRPGHALMITATPTERGAQDYWTILNFLKPWEFRSYWRWVSWFCESENNGFGSKIVGNKNEDVIRDLMGPMVLRRKVSEVADVPEMIFETIRAPLTDRLQNIYNDIASETLVDIADETFNVSNKLAEMLRLRQVSTVPSVLGLDVSSPKKGIVSALAKRFEEFQILVFSTFTQGMNDVISELIEGGVSCTKYTGQDAEVREFLDGKTRVLVANPSVGGVGLDLSNAKVIIYYDLPLSATILRQSMARTTKIGDHDPRIIFSVCCSPIEEAVSKLLAEKQNSILEVDILTSILHKLGSEPSSSSNSSA